MNLAISTFLFLLCISFNSFADTNHQYEKEIISAAYDIQASDPQAAIKKSLDLIKKYPNSKMAQMIYADMLLAKIQPLNAVGAGLGHSTKQQDLSHELKVRIKHNQSDHYKTHIPSDILLLSNSQPYVLIADMNEARIYVFKNEQGVPVYETDFFMTIGLKGYGKEVEGDQRTPLGVYHFTRYIDGKELPDLYGTGAFPINYPNHWDRKNKRTGSGIWLHGTPSYTYNRAPQASDGCFVISNEDMLSIAPYVSTELKTPVLLVENIEWIKSEQWQANQREILQTFSQWQQDWQSLNHQNYISHYSTEYFVDGRNLKQMSNHKKWVNRKKEFIHIEYSNLNIFKYPGETNLRLLEYEQDYKSNNFNSISQKELFWKKDVDGQWRIVFES